MKEINKAIPNLQLKREREQRQMSQEQLAEEIGTTALNISRWERGNTVPSLHFRRQITEFFGKSAKELGLIKREDEGAQEQTSFPYAEREFVFPSSEEFVYDSAIPFPLTTLNLIGRQQSSCELKQQLQSRKNLAIHGLPGVGKTALVAAIVNTHKTLEYFHNGVLWASLGSKPDIAGLLKKWSNLLGISSAETDMLVSIEEWTKALRAAIGTRRFLLVIDDAWRIEDALSFKVGGPNCTHLVTTRFPKVALQFTEDDPMALRELSEEESMMLIARLAPEAVASEPDEVRSVVRSVGGLPLALTFIGKHLRLHAYGGQLRRLRAALNRLHQFDERLQLAQPQAPAETIPGLPTGEQISLQTVIGLSDQRLDEEASYALYALSIFPPKPNSFSEEAALAICAKPVEILDTLTDAGLLEVSAPNRYTLHQVIVDYSRLHLLDTNVEERMVKYFADYVEAHELDYDALELETDNMLAALQTASKRELQTDLVRGVNAFSHFLQTRGLYTLAEAQLKLAEQTARSLNDECGLTAALFALGRIGEKREDYVQAEAYYLEGLTLARQLGHPEKISALLTNLGRMASSRGNYVQAEEDFREALPLAHQIGHHERISSLFINVGELALRRGEYTQTEAYSNEGLALARQIEHRERISFLLAKLGEVTTSHGRYKQVETYLHTGMDLARHIGNSWLVCYLLLDWGELHLKQQQLDSAFSAFQEALQLAQDMYQELVASALYGLARIAMSSGNKIKACRQGQESLNIFMAIDHERADKVRQWLAELSEEEGEIDVLSIEKRDAASNRELVTMSAVLQ